MNRREFKAPVSATEPAAVTRRSGLALVFATEPEKVGRRNRFTQRCNEMTPKQKQKSRAQIARKQFAPEWRGLSFTQNHTHLEPGLHMYAHKYVYIHLPKRERRTAAVRPPTMDS